MYKNFNALGATHKVVDIKAILAEQLPRVPHTIRLLLENHVRGTGEYLSALGAIKLWLKGEPSTFEFIYRPNRLLMHDTTCTPALADIAALRDAVANIGKDPQLLSPTLPVEVSVDHSLSVDTFGRPEALHLNLEGELERNAERYKFMKWASGAMDNFNVNPPGTGIMHTINLEQLATLLVASEDGFVHPDMMLGTDSHTPMVNGIGVLGWGVGGLEAESVMFGQSTSVAFPRTVGVKLTGKLPAGVSATDLAIVITHQLRKLDVTGCFVEFFGDGVVNISADTRAVVANMAPEYGATTGFFPADQETLRYLARTGRSALLLQAAEQYFTAQGLWFDPVENPQFDRVLHIDLAQLKPMLAGPRRPQDQITFDHAMSAVEQSIGRKLHASVGAGIPDGAIGVAAITSCTNTSAPELLVAAGLLARKARAKGLAPPSWVKTSLAPGSPSAKYYLEKKGLLEDLSSVGFDIVGFGCSTCIGNSGSLPNEIEVALGDKKAVVAVISGNRNFPGRVHSKLDLAFITSPAHVVAYALKGTVQGDLYVDPLGVDAQGKEVFLRDIWPTDDEVQKALAASFETQMVEIAFAEASHSPAWAALEAPKTACFPWADDSLTIRSPKFVDFTNKNPSRLGHYIAHPLLVLSDDITTDHISPAGWIDPVSDAGQWLTERGANPDDLNVYASYRGNWEVMVRGLFTNRSILNYIDTNLSPGFTQLPDGSPSSLFEAARHYAKTDTPAVIFAGHRYGMGSSRDWAAKGVSLLGVRAIVAKSFERIHRSNLIGMGILPLEITDQFDPSATDLSASDSVEINFPAAELKPRQEGHVLIRRENGKESTIAVRAAVETMQEVELLKRGGVLPSIFQDVVAD